MLEFLRKQLAQLLEQRKGLKAALDQVLVAPTAENRALTAAEKRRFDTAEAALRAHDDQVEEARQVLATAEETQRRSDAAGRLAAGLGQTGDQRSSLDASRGTGGGAGDRREPSDPQWVRVSDRRPAALARGQRFGEHPVVAQHAATRAGADGLVTGTHGSFGQLVRSMSTSSGSAVVPTIWAADIIDRARNHAAVLQAGAQLVPMDAKTVQIGRLTGDPTAAFRSEGSTITASDPTFDNVTLDAKTMSTIVVGSLEWFQDAPNVDTVVSEAIAKAIALQLDIVSLFGGLTTGSEGFSLATPPNPRGVLATLLAVASSAVLGAATNGTAQTSTSYWNEVIDTIYQVRNANETPNGIIWASKLAQQYAKAYDTTGQPLAMPAAVADVPRFESNQIPSFTQGTMTSRATDLFVGDWRQLLIGQRLDLTISTLTERYAESGQISLVAHWRGDVQAARPRAFAVYRYLQGA